MIKYLSDEQGNKTDVVIPVEEWNYLQENGVMRNTQNTSKDLNWMVEMMADNKTEYEPVFLIKHYQEILSLIDKKKSIGKEEWVLLYSEYFKYYNALDEFDISLLFLFRNINNKSIFTNSPIDDNLLDNFYKDYRLRNLETEHKLDNREYSELIHKAKTMNEFAFLQYFKLNFKITIPKLKSKRLQRIPDRNRLFIYDLLVINEYISDYIDFNKYSHLIKSKKYIISFIANYLYNGLEPQVYRLYQEAEERIKQLIP